MLKRRTQKSLQRMLRKTKNMIEKEDNDIKKDVGKVHDKDYKGSDNMTRSN